MARIFRFSWIFLFVAVLFFPGFSQGDNPVKLKVIVDSATIKVTPEIDGETLARIPLNTMLDSMEKQGEWYRVSFDREGLEITGFIHEMLVRELSEEELAEEAGVSTPDSLESQSEVVRAIELRLEESKKLIRQENKFEDALVSLSPLIAKTFRVEDLQKQRELATEIFLWMGMSYSGLGETYAALQEIRNMFEVDYAFGKTITRNIYDQNIGGLIEQAEKEYLGIIKYYSLHISTRPERAKITVNGEYIGETPSLYQSESPQVRLEIDKEGFAMVKEEMFLSQEKTDREYVLERLGRNVEVKSVPTGAKIYLDEKDTGLVTDSVLSYVPFGLHKIRMSKKYYADWEGTVEIPLGEEPISIDVVLPGKDYVYREKWGAPNQAIFQQPNSLALDNNGIIYVADHSDAKIKRITPEGRIDSDWASGGKDFKNLKSPGGIAVGSQGYIYVTDEKKHAVLKFDKNGKLVKKWGKEGVGNSEFRIPLGISVDNENNIYVADSANHCIKKFTNLGEFVKKIGKRGTADGEFLFPVAIALNDKNDLFVLDRNRLQKFSQEGELLESWGITGSNDGEFNVPMGFFVDENGFVYIADSGNNRVQKFTEKGQFITKWGNKGSSEGSMNYPSGIVLNHAGDVFIVERENNRVQVFRLLSDDEIE